MSSAASPSMPGAYSFLRSTRERPLSTFSTDTLFFSPTEETAPISPSLRTSFEPANDEDELAHELSALAQLRRDVRNNLRLRPITTTSDAAGPPNSAAVNLAHHHRRRSLELEQDPPSATSSVFSWTTAPNSPIVGGSSIPPPPIPVPARSPSHKAPLPPPESQLQLPLNHHHQSYITPESLAAQLSSSQKFPLVIDTRPPAAWQSVRLRISVSLAIPSLILKRSRKQPTGAFSSLEALRAFISNDESRKTWDCMIAAAPNSRWNGDIVVTDELMDEPNGTAPLGSSSTTAWALLPALTPLVAAKGGSATYLRGGISAARTSPHLRPFLAGDDFDEEDPSEMLASPIVRSPLAMSPGGGGGSATDSVLWSYLNAESPAPDSRPQYAASSSHLRPNASLAASSSGSGSSSSFSSTSSSSVSTKPPSASLHDASSSSKKIGLSSLRTDTGSSRKRDNMPLIDSSASSSSSSAASSSSASSSRTNSSSSGNSSSTASFGTGRRSMSIQNYDLSPSPSPSASSFARPQPSRGNNRGMTLGIDTSSPAERPRTISTISQSNLSLTIPTSPSTRQPPPKLQLRTLPPTKSSTLDVVPPSPSRGNLAGGRMLHLPRSPHRPNLIITASASPTKGDSDSDGSTSGQDVPFASRLLIPGVDHDAGGSRRARDRDPVRGGGSGRDGGSGSDGAGAGGCSLADRRRARSPSPYLGSPRTARPPDSFGPIDASSSMGQDTLFPPGGVGGPGGSGMIPPSPRFGGGFNMSGAQGGDRSSAASSTAYSSTTSSLSSFSDATTTSPSSAHTSTTSADSSEPPEGQFIISTILPNFLYLGPEPSSPEHVAQLRELGVKRVLNMALECEDDFELAGRGGEGWMERYCKIPMRDIVEEEGVRRGVREVCDFIDDARLHSQPTYVHCKAGKSRSVTAVMAYLIHANHWPLAQAYAFVFERRKGISPNIGFVSELMSFEEEELGGKSLGVIPQAPGGHVGENSSNASGSNSAAKGKTSESSNGFVPTHGHSQSTSSYLVGGAPYGSTSSLGMTYPSSSSSSTSTATTGNNGGGGPNMANMLMMHSMNSRRGPHHVRDSLPVAPTFHHQPASFAPDSSSSPDSNSNNINDKEGGGGVDEVLALAQEVEVKNADGRYRHARRAPVNENTLQPMRRVSKAGLESWGFDSSSASGSGNE